MKMLLKKLFTLTLAILIVASIGTIPASAAEANVKITKNGQVVDSLNGVDAKYSPGTGNTNTGDLSCAGYVKRYYSTIYGVTVSNLLSNHTPKVSEKEFEFKEITSGFMVGDVVRLPGHWGVIKGVSGNTLTLIEQNWKWADKAGNTYAKVNRSVNYGSTNGLVVFRLYKDGQPVNATPCVTYESHLQDIGWTPAVSNGTMSGTTGESRRMEAIKISLQNISGGICYRAHIQDIGWMDWCSDNAVAGTEGQSLRLEAICINLTGQAAKEYSVWYRVHVQDIGWMDWCKDGGVAGTEGRSLRVEAIEVKLVAK